MVDIKIMNKKVTELTERDKQKLRKWHKETRPRGAKIDRKHTGKRTPVYVRTWVKHPDRYDLKGVDTPIPLKSFVVKEKDPLIKEGYILLEYGKNYDNDRLNGLRQKLEIEGLLTDYDNGLKIYVKPREAGAFVVKIFYKGKKIFDKITYLIFSEIDEIKKKLADNGVFLYTVPNKIHFKNMSKRLDPSKYGSVKLEIHDNGFRVTDQTGTVKSYKWNELEKFFKDLTGLEDPDSLIFYKPSIDKGFRALVHELKEKANSRHGQKYSFSCITCLDDWLETDGTVAISRAVVNGKPMYVMFDRNHDEIIGIDEDPVKLFLNNVDKGKYTLKQTLALVEALMKKNPTDNIRLQKYLEKLYNDAKIIRELEKVLKTEITPRIIESSDGLKRKVYFDKDDIFAYSNDGKPPIRIDRNMFREGKYDDLVAKWYVLNDILIMDEDHIEDHIEKALGKSGLKRNEDYKIKRDESGLYYVLIPLKKILDMKLTNDIKTVFNEKSRRLKNIGVIYAMENDHPIATYDGVKLYNIMYTMKKYFGDPKKIYYGNTAPIIIGYGDSGKHYIALAPLTENW